MILALSLAFSVPLVEDTTRRFSADQITYGERAFFLCKEVTNTGKIAGYLMIFRVDKGKGHLTVQAPKGMDARSFQLIDPVRHADQQVVGDIITTIVAIDGQYQDVSYKGELTLRAVGEKAPEASLLLNQGPTSLVLQCSAPILIPEKTK